MMGKDREARARVPPTAFKAGRANSTSVRENEKAAEGPNVAAHRYCKRKSLAREPQPWIHLVDVLPPAELVWDGHGWCSAGVAAVENLK